jgi:DNA-binding FadR family transcriptional regulator
MFDRIQHHPAYKIVCEKIEREILSGRLSAGQQIPTETELAKQFGLTRHTVREGIRLLEQSGLVRRAQGRRLHVALPHHTELAPRTTRALLMQKVTFRELWEVSIGLETFAAEIAAQRIKPEQIEELEANIDLMEKKLELGRSIIELDIKFHSIIAESTNNRVLLLAREPISVLFHPALEKIFKHQKTRKLGPERLIEAHRKIAGHLRRGHAAQAKDWMHKHMMDFHRGYDLCGLDLDSPIEFSDETNSARISPKQNRK